MNSSIWFANRITHIKIVTVALLASVVVVIVGMSAGMSGSNFANIDRANDVVIAGVQAFVAAETKATAR